MAAMPQQFLGSAGVTIDARVTGFALMSMLSGIVFATLPALSVSGTAERAGRLLSLGAVRSNLPPRVAPTPCSPRCRSRSRWRCWWARRCS